MFPVIYALCVMLPEDPFLGDNVLHGVMHFILAFTNGHLTSGIFAITSERLEEDDKKHAGFSLVLFLMSG